MDITKIFKIEDEEEFNTIAIETFKNQYRSIEIYKKYIDTRGIDVNKVDHFKGIPFLPIEFFKTFSIKIICLPVVQTTIHFLSCLLTVPLIIG